MKILYVKDGINIHYNSNEEISETIFGLDDNDNIIENITFNCNIIPDVSSFEEIKKYIYDNDRIINIDNGYLFYSFAYQKSFCHFLTQTVPKLWEYSNHYDDYKLLIPIHSYNNLCKDILQLYGINENNIILLDDKYIYNINRFIITKKYEAPPSNFTEDHLNTYHRIRENININVNISPYRKIYLKRDGVPDKNYGNDETGIIRKIINENELIYNLESRGFEIITLGNKSIY